MLVHFLQLWLFLDNRLISQSSLHVLAAVVIYWDPTAQDTTDILAIQVLLCTFCVETVNEVSVFIVPACYLWPCKTKKNELY